MSESMSVLAMGIAAKWRVSLADAAMEERDEFIYQQRWPNQNCVIHTCVNYGAPFDGARHRGAQAVWDEIATLRRAPKTAAEWRSEIARLRAIYEAEI